MTILGILKNTKYFRKYWENRDINWEESYFTPNHPHRNLIIETLKGFNFRSVLEVGCAAGANLYRIKQAFPHSDVGGIDWNEKALEVARKYLPKASVLQKGEATDIYISNKGTDILLSDHCFIYLSKKDFKKVLKEAKRATRVGVVFCEFHEPRWWRRRIIKMTTGYGVFNYERELIKEGFYDVRIIKLTPKDWPGTEKEKGLRCIISARL